MQPFSGQKGPRLSRKGLCRKCACMRGGLLAHHKTADHARTHSLKPRRRQRESPTTPSYGVLATTRIVAAEPVDGVAAAQERLPTRRAARPCTPTSDTTPSSVTLCRACGCMRGGLLAHQRTVEHARTDSLKAGRRQRESPTTPSFFVSAVRTFVQRPCSIVRDMLPKRKKSAGASAAQRIGRLAKVADVCVNQEQTKDCSEAPHDATSNVLRRGQRPQQPRRHGVVDHNGLNDSSSTA